MTKTLGTLEASVWSDVSISLSLLLIVTVRIFETIQSLTRVSISS